MSFVLLKDGNFVNIDKMEKLTVYRDSCKYPSGHEQENLRWKVCAITSDNFSYLLGEFRDEGTARDFLQYTVDYSAKKLT